MKASNTLKNKVNFFIDSEFNLDEDKIIEEAITTPFEKVLKILNNVKTLVLNLTYNKIPNLITCQLMLNDIDFVIKRIQSNTLHNFDLSGENEQLEKYSQENPEMKLLLEFFSDYSESKDLRRRNKLSSASKTTRITSLKGFDYSKGNHFLDEAPTPSTIRRISNVKGFQNPLEKENRYEIIKIEEEDEKGEDFSTLTLKFGKENGKNSKEGSKNNSSNDLRGIVKINEKPKTPEKNKYEYSLSNNNLSKKSLDEYEGSPKKVENRLTFSALSQISKINLDAPEQENNNSLDKDLYKNSSPMKQPQKQAQQSYGFTPRTFRNVTVDLKTILNKDFNIHEFETKVTRAKVLPLVGKELFTSLHVIDLISQDKIDFFLNEIAKGYVNKAPYHNSIHGADVAQTIGIFLTCSNIEEIAVLINNDVLALISAALAHDLGHPGTNNSYQINTYSEYSITYNDQSVLENYHASFFFNICRRPESNIFEKFSDFDYRQLRKRIINLILSTDMIYHAKILTNTKTKMMLYKEALEQNKLTNGENSSTIYLIQQDSKEFWDDQQKILDFLIHSADLSHNSKDYKISKRWTDLLMEEFWAQGDNEKQLGIPVSFLCDRLTADVPKSQIGFIKGIIIPSFEVLVGLLPDLNFLIIHINNNLEEWGKMVEEKKMVTPRIMKTPMNKDAPKFPNISNIKSVQESNINSNKKHSLFGELEPKK